LPHTREIVRHGYPRDDGLLDVEGTYGETFMIIWPLHRRPDPTL